MKKGIFLSVVVLATLLSGCKDPSSSSSNEQSDNSSSTSFLTKANDIIDIENLDLSIDEEYALPLLINENYKNKTITCTSSNNDVVFPSVDSILFGIDYGTCVIKIVIDDTYYDEITVNVKDEEYMHEYFTTDLARLNKMSFTVLGDSISDINVIPNDYSPNKQNYWCEQLVDKANMTMYNFAISGSTTGVCDKQSYDQKTSIMGTAVVRKSEVKEAIKKSQYVFIYLGNNDISFGTHLGNIGEINDSNYLSKESFKGAYSDIISHIKQYNPRARIVCLSLSPSTWGIGSKDASKTQATSRAHMSSIIGEIADEMGCKYINIHEVWDETSPTDMQKYCADGIHPLTAGYDLIVDKILHS